MTSISISSSSSSSTSSTTAFSLLLGFKGRQQQQQQRQQQQRQQQQRRLLHSSCSLSSRFYPPNNRNYPHLYLHLLPPSSPHRRCRCRCRFSSVNSYSYCSFSFSMEKRKKTSSSHPPYLSVQTQTQTLISLSLLLLPTHHSCLKEDDDGNNNNNNNNGGNGDNGNGNGKGNGRGQEDDDRSSNTKNHPPLTLLLLLLLLLALLSSFSSALALSHCSWPWPEGVWEVRGGKWTRLLPNDDSFLVDDNPHPHRRQQQNQIQNQNLADGPPAAVVLLESCWRQCKDAFFSLMLPQGYPHSVSTDYLHYSLWRAVQGIASQINGVLSTQSLLYAIGLGKGAIPTAAAVNWVLKDGIGYLSKIFLSKFGRHFDVNPKGWRLFADLLENAAYGLEILTPAFPHFFLLIGAAAGAGRSAAALIQAATRSCFYAGFAVERNSAEVIAKGEAQGMVSKFLGIMLGIALANYIGSSTPLALASFSAVTGVHMYCNLRSYQSIQLRSLNPYRASLVFSEYLLSGQVPLIKDVNDEEPLFSGLSIVKINKHTEPSTTLSVEAKSAAAEICSRLQLGYKFSDVIKNKEDATALFDLFRNERYMLIENCGRFRVILTEGCSAEDMLKSLFHVNYLYWLERNVGMESRSIREGCKPGGMLHISLDYVEREFNHIKRDGSRAGWLTDDGLIARPLPNRLRPVYAD